MMQPRKISVDKKVVVEVTAEKGKRRRRKKIELAARYDASADRKRQAELVYWELDMEDIMVRLRRVNRALDARLRKLSTTESS